MDRCIAERIARAVSKDGILKMLQRAEIEFNGWDERSAVNANMNKAYIFNLYVSIFNSIDYSSFPNILIEFGEFYPEVDSLIGDFNKNEYHKVELLSPVDWSFHARCKWPSKRIR